MTSSLEAAVIALSKGSPNAGYEVGIPKFHNGALFIPIAEDVAGLEDVVIEDFKSTLKGAVNGAPTINVIVGYEGNSITLSPSTKEEGGILEDTEKFLRAYKMLLDGASIRSVKLTILGQRRRQPRQPQDIIIDILQILRDHGGGIRQNPLLKVARLQYSQYINYTEYLSKKGLIEIVHNARNVTITATEEGMRIELVPENFRDFTWDSGIRTKTEIYQDIANIIYLRGGRALKTQIIYGANLSLSLYQLCLQEMVVRKGYASRITLNNGQKEAYELTDAGKSMFPDPGARVKALGKKGAGEILAKILELAQSGANKTKLMYGASTSFEGINQYLDFLLKYRLISQSGSVFRATGLYDSIDGETLSYALDLVLSEEKSSGFSRRTRQLIQLDILKMSSEPRGIAYFVKSVDSVYSVYRKHIAELQKEGMLQEIPSGKHTLYQITRAGTDFLNRVNATADVLRAAMQKAA